MSAERESAIRAAPRDSDTSPETVEAYEAVFFKIRDRLQHAELITKVILRKAIEVGIYERDYDPL